MKKKIALVLGSAAVAALGASGVASASSTCYYSPRGCVSVGGYYKPSTGTYVRPYVRNYPGYGSYSYRPSYRSSYSLSYNYGYRYRPSHSYSW